MLGGARTCPLGMKPRGPPSLRPTSVLHLGSVTSFAELTTRYAGCLSLAVPTLVLELPKDSIGWMRHPNDQPLPLGLSANYVVIEEGASTLCFPAMPVSGVSGP